MKTLSQLAAATVAATVASGAFAYAVTVSPSGSLAVPNGVVRPAAFPGDLGAATMSAGVSQTGELVRSSGAVAAKALSPANYDIEFGRDITGCAVTATPTSAPFFTVVASYRGPDLPKSVYVGTYNTSTGRYEASGFNLIVHCGR